MGSIQNLDVQIPQEIIQYWGWFLAFGIALLLLGVVAVVRSVTATIVSMLFFGWLLVFASETGLGATFGIAASAKRR